MSDKKFAQFVSDRVRINLARSFIHKPDTDAITEVVKDQMRTLIDNQQKLFGSYDHLPVPEVTVTVNDRVAYATIHLIHPISKQKLPIPDWLHQLLGTNNE